MAKDNPWQRADFQKLLRELEAKVLKPEMLPMMPREAR